MNTGVIAVTIPLVVSVMFLTGTIGAPILVREALMLSLSLSNASLTGLALRRREQADTSQPRAEPEHEPPASACPANGAAATSA